MKLNEELIHSDRVWDSIHLKLEFGYFASNPPITITCYSDGMLVFTAGHETGGKPFENAIEDAEHSVSKKSLGKLDDLIDEITRIEYLEGDQIEDGPSFECCVHLSKGTVTGFHYCSLWLSEKFKDLENGLRKILREDFFLNKYKKEFRF